MRIDLDDLVDRRMPAMERRGRGLHHPRDPGHRILALDGVDHRQHVHAVADGAQHDDADPVERRRHGRYRTRQSFTRSITIGTVMCIIPSSRRSFIRREGSPKPLAMRSWYLRYGP